VEAGYLIYLVLNTWSTPEGKYYEIGYSSCVSKRVSEAAVCQWHAA